VEAAQAAMASPLLEAGAIDGARGILINITGSSSLKLSEVNEASSLIQSAAHEDANIIFGAVLDEKMGDEVKITVIATGFRDQMPQRRARMLSIGEVVMVEEPIVSVPVISSGSWMRESSAPAVAKANTPPPFLSQVDGDEAADEAGSGDPFFFSSTPSTASPDPDPQFGAGFGSREPELVAAAVRPQFAEMAEETPFTPLPRDYASDFGAGMRGAGTEEHSAQPATRALPEANEESHRDLDTPAFLRRLRF
jgi:cell division protein FtsZ